MNLRRQTLMLGSLDVLSEQLDYRSLDQMRYAASAAQMLRNNNLSPFMLMHGREPMLPGELMVVGAGQQCASLTWTRICGRVGSSQKNLKRQPGESSVLPNCFWMQVNRSIVYETTRTVRSSGVERN